LDSITHRHEEEANSNKHEAVSNLEIISMTWNTIWMIEDIQVSFMHIKFKATHHHLHETLIHEVCRSHTRPIMSPCCFFTKSSSTSPCHLWVHSPFIINQIMKIFSDIFYFYLSLYSLFFILIHAIKFSNYN